MNFAAGRLDPILKRLLCDASCFSREDFRKKEIMRCEGGSLLKDFL